MSDTIDRLAKSIYGDAVGADVGRRIAKLLAERGEGLKAARGIAERLSERDALLIAYGDMLDSDTPDGVPPLRRLGRFLERRAAGLFTFVHVLPFYPYSSDDGFSVKDHRAVDPRLGSWADIEALTGKFKGAFDLVLNHGSVQGEWFARFLRREEHFDRWFVTREAGYDASPVFRPRTHPLLTAFRRPDGSTVNVWTTFSADQADYDFSNPEVLLEFVDILLEYVAHGARLVRLDAIAYLWKKDGTSCLSLPETHAVVKLMRAVVETLGLDLAILTETNVPHEENVSYFGDGDEAHLVYNFALPPLVLHAAVSGDAGPLRRWAADLGDPGDGRVFLNFLASHDGIGVTPARGLVDPREFAATIEAVRSRGGYVSYKSTPAGEIPYEINCSYLDAVAPPDGGARERARAFMCTQAVMLALAGVPAAYFHSWVGSGNWKEGVERLGYNRAINRQRPEIGKLEAELDDASSLRGMVHGDFRRLLSFRAAHRSFSPYAPQRVIPAAGSVFAVVRGGGRFGEPVLCAHNLGSAEAAIEIPDGLRRGRLEVGRLELKPWETRWIEYGPSGINGEVSL